jgi:hypothetical protein
VERYRGLVRAIDDEVGIRWMQPNRNILVNSKFDPRFSLLNVKYVLATHPLHEHEISVEVAREPVPAADIALARDDRVTGRFTACRPGLNRVDVPFAPRDADAAGSVRFALWRDEERPELLADITVSDENLTKGGSHSFFFAPIPDSAGQDFAWSLEPVGTQGSTPWRIRQAAEAPPRQPAFTAYSTQLQLVDVCQGVWIYENPNVLPRAYVVHRWEIASDHRALDRLVSTNFSPWTEVLLPEALSAKTAAAMARAPLRTSSRVRIVDYGPHRVELEANMTDPGLLVLADTHYPGWDVTVDEQPAELLRANYALRGVQLDAGKHQVVFRFVPRSFHLGLLLTGTTLLLTLATLALSACTAESFLCDLSTLGNDLCDGTRTVAGSNNLRRRE